MVTIMRNFLTGKLFTSLGCAERCVKLRGSPPLRHRQLVLSLRGPKGRSNLRDCFASLAMTNITILILTLLLGAVMPVSPSYSADTGTDFEAVDDLTVSGQEGTKNDADLEVKGVSSFAKDVFIESGILASPYGGIGRYQNLLTYSEQFENAAWSAINSTVTANSVASPDGTTTGDTLTSTVNGGEVRYTTTINPANKTYSLSLWLKTASGTQTTTLNLNSTAIGDLINQNITVTSSWQRFSVTGTATSGQTGNLLARIFPGSTSGTGTVYAWGAQLEQSSTPGVYVKTTTDAISTSRGMISSADVVIKGNLQVSGAGPHYFTTGNVGIGTTNPASVLDVQGGIRFGASGANNIINTSTAGGAATGDLYWGNKKLSGAITIKEVDGSPNLTDIETLEFDQGTGLYVSDQGNNTARITIGSHWKELYIDGVSVGMIPVGEETLNFIKGNDVTITANSSSTPKSLTFSVEDDIDASVVRASSASGLTFYDNSSNLGMFIKSGGNVGIGTTGSSQKLEVAGAGLFSGTRNLTIDPAAGEIGSTGYLEIKSGGSSNLILNSATSQVLLAVGDKLSDSDNTAYYLDPSNSVTAMIVAGNVGIGTTAPGSRLEAVGIGTTSATSSLNIKNSAGASMLYVRDDNKVGIGTTNPNWNLHINGSDYTVAAIGDSGTGWKGLAFTQGTSWVANIIAVGTGGAGEPPESLLIQNRRNAPIHIYTGTAADKNIGITINSSGNVGINTTAPEAKFDVAGPLRVGTAGDVNISHDLYFEDITSANIKSYGPLTIQSGNPNSNYNLVLKGTGTGKVYIDDDLEITGTTTFPSGLTVASGNITASSGNVSASSGSGTFGTLTVTGATNLATTSGNVGIGTTNPTSKLVVAGNINPSGSDTYNLGSSNSLYWNEVWADDYYGNTINARNPEDLVFAGWGGHPSISLDADEDIVLGFANGGNLYVDNDSLFVNSVSGNVGIGTTGPVAGLHVVSDSARFTGKTGNNTITIEGANASSRGYLNLVGDGATFTLNEFGGSARITYPGELQFGNTSIFDRIVMQADGDFIVNSGKIGIGTTNPGDKLEVSGNIKLSSSGNVVTWTADDADKMYLYGGAGRNKIATSYGWVTGYHAGNTAYGTNEGYHIFYTSTPGAWSERMRIDKAGNVGIGTSAPNRRLDINGSAIIYDRTATTGTTNLTIQAGAGQATGPTRLFDIFANNGTTPRFHVTDVGNVGIGTTDPSQKLEVAGNIKATQIDAAINTSGNITSSGNLQISGVGPHYISNGNVGIGTTLPGTKLDVIGGAIRTNNQLISTIATGTAPLAVTSTTVVTNLNSDLLDGAQASMTAGNSTIVQRNASGYVYANYFNTTADVTAAAASHFAIQTGTDSFIRWQTPANARTSLGLGTMATQNANAVSITGGSITGITDLAVSDGGTGASTFSANYLLKGNTTSPITSSIIYDNGTNVGIGTTVPGTKLHIKDASNAQLLLEKTSSNKMSIYQTSGWNSELLGGAYYDGTNEVYGTTTRSAFKINFQHDGNASPQFISFLGAPEGTAGQPVSWTEIMRLQRNGNVGIGTTSPSSDLQIGSTGALAITASDTIDDLSIQQNFSSSTASITVGGNLLIAKDTTTLTGATSTFNPTGVMVQIQPSTGGTAYTGKLIDLQVSPAGGSLDSKFNVDASGNVFIKGNLTTQGTQIITNTVTVDIQNNKLVLNTNQTGSPTQDATIEVERGTSTNSYIKWNETTDKWEFNDGTTTANIGSGSVTSVGLSAPADIFTVTNSPVTTTGTLTLTKVNQNANLIYAGPSSGGAAAPAFRALVDNDIPDVITINNGLLYAPTSGNVGIGTTVPNQKLETSGNILLGANNVNSFMHGGAIVSMSADSNILIVADSNDTTGPADGGDIVFGSGSSIDTDVTRTFTFADAYPTGVPRTEHMRIKGTGNVGIGTTGPLVGLHVAANAAAIPSTTATPNGSFIVGGNNTAVIGSMGVYNAAPAYFWLQPRDSGGATWYNMVLNPNGGNVGIGTTGPVSKLEISGGDLTLPGGGTYGLRFGTTYPRFTSKQTDDITLQGVGTNQNTVLRVSPKGTGTSGYLADIQVFGTDFVADNNNFNSIGIGWNPVNGNPMLYTDYRGTGTLKPITLQIGNGNGTFTEAMRITTTGNVGIGTTSPTAKLQVSGGDLVVSGVISAGGVPLDNKYIQLQSATPGTQQTGNLNITGVGIFQGNVGIGTTAPAYKLQVEGTAEADTVRFSTSFIHTGRGGFVAGDGATDVRLFANGLLGLSGGGHDTTNDVTISTSGNVGIGTTVPVRLLHVEGSGAGRGQISLLQSDSVATDSTAGIYWHAATTDYAIYRTSGAWTASTYQQLKLDWPTGIILDPGTGDNAGYDKSYVEITGGKGLRVTQGNVGIGTTGPSSALAFKAGTTGITFEPADVRTKAMIYPSGTNSEHLYVRSAEGGNLYLMPGSTGTGSLYIQGSGPGDFYVQTDADSDFNIGSGQLFVKGSDGNIGIGTSNPGYKLEVSGHLGLSGDSKYIYINGNGVITSSGGHTYVGMEGNTQIRGNEIDIVPGTTYDTAVFTDSDSDFYVGTNQLYVVGNTGNVGIGTTGPVDILHIDKASNPRIRFTDNETGRTASDGLQIGLTDGVSPFIWNYENTPLRFATNNAEKVRIDSIGNVGIGTTGPGAKLTVWDSTDVTPTGGGALRIGASATDLITIDNNEIQAIAGGVTSNLHLNADGGSVQVHANTAGTFAVNTDDLYVDSTGNVGIGTTSPTAKLQVSGGDLVVSGVISAGGVPLDNKYIQLQSATPGTQQTGNLNITGVGIFQGNVGIGTTNPQQKLHMFGGSSTVPLIQRFEWNRSGGPGSGEVLGGLEWYKTDVATAAAKLVAVQKSTSPGHVGFELSVQGQDGNLRKGLELYRSASANQTVTFFSEDTAGTTDFYLGTAGAAISDGIRNAKMNFQSAAYEKFAMAIYQSDLSGNAGHGLLVKAGGYSSSNSGNNDVLKLIRSGDNVALFNVKNSGNVGIGTTEPDQPLTIAGAFAGYGLHVDSSSGAGIEIDRGGTTNSHGVLFQTAGVDDYYIGNYNQNDGLYIKEGGYEGTTLVSILSGGNVGIGTTGPGAPLEIERDQSRSTFTGTAKGVLHLEGGSDYTANDITAITFHGDSATYPNIAQTIIGSSFQNSGTQLFFGTSNNYDAGVTNTAMWINHLGNVGIGTTTPVAKLYVAGDVMSTGGLSVSNSIVTPYGGIGHYENIMTYSDQLDHANWAKGAAVSVSPNATTAPDGTVTADSLLASAATEYHFVRQYKTVSALAYTFSIYAKKNTWRYLGIRVGNGIPSAVFDFDTETFIQSGSAINTFTKLANGWYRLVSTYVPAAGSYYYGPYISDASGSENWTSNGTESVYVWGAQLEQDSNAGVYAKTTSGAVAASRGIVSTGDILMPSLKLSGGSITDTTGTVSVGNSNNLNIAGNLQVTGAGPHYIQAGNVGIGTTLPGTKLDVIGGAIRTNNQLISTIATGTSPLAVSSTTVVTNLNADLLDGAQASMTAGNSTIVQRNASGYVYANYFNTTADVTAAAASHFAIQTGTDSFIRWQTPANARTSLGLGTMATQNANAVSITGGSITGITDLAVSDGGTGASTFSANYLLKGNTMSPISSSIVYDNGTNVGIGTTGPSTLLSITGNNVAGRGQVSITSGSATDLSRMTFYKGGVTPSYIGDIYGDPANSKFVYDAPTGFSQRWSIQGSEKMTLNSGGNVGIGTTAPSSMLHLASPGSDTAVITMEKTGTTSQNNILGRIDWVRGSSVVGARIRALAEATDGNRHTGLVFSTSDSVGTLGDHVFINNQGRVGIGNGTNTPAALLSVGTVGGTLGSDGTTSVATTGLNLSITATESYAMGITNGYANGGNGLLISAGRNNDSGNYALRVKNYVEGKELLSVMGQGNVGIGTTSPNAALQVAGTINATAYQEGGTAFSSKYVQLQATTPGTQQTGNLNISGTGIFQGNVGIGTNNPMAKLEVQGNIYSSNAFFPGNNVVQTSRKFGDDGSFLTATNLKLSGTLDMGGQILSGIGSIRPNSTDFSFQTAGGNTKFRLSTTDGSLWVGGSSSDGTALAPLHVVGNSIITGNVGIGTTAPNEKLHVAGNVRMDNGGIIFYNSTGGPYTKTVLRATGADASGMRVLLDSGGPTIIGGGESADAINTNVAVSSEELYLSSDNTGANGAIKFVTSLQNNWTGRVDAMTILGNGNVGIGTTSPTTDLQIGSTGALAITASDTTDDLSIQQNFSSSTASITVGGNLLIAKDTTTLTGATSTFNPTGVMVQIQPSTGGTAYTGKLIDLQVSPAGGSLDSKFNVDASGNVFIKGNLTTQGTQIITNTVTVDIQNNKLVLNTNQTGSPTQDATIEVERGTSTNSYLKWNETTDKWEFNDGTTTANIGSGSVTSVGLSAPADIFTVTNSPVTTTGTLTLTKVNQNANLIYAGPSSGGAAAPTFRALVDNDIPDVITINNGLLYAPTSGNVGIGTTVPRSKLDTWTGTMTGAANDYEKAQFTMSGGGTVTWGGTGNRLQWTARFIAIPVQRTTTASAGYIDINQPTTDIPAGQVFDGIARSATSAGVVLNSWEALYAAHAVGGNNTAITYYIVKYTADFNPPSNWLLVAAINGDNNTAKLGTGITLKPSGSWSAGTDSQYVQLQGSTPGTQQTGHLNVSGTGIFSGNVGIGTASPKTGLTLWGANSREGLSLYNIYDSLTAGLYSIISTGNAVQIRRNTDAAGNFATFTTPFIINSSDNVGIGTMSPSSGKLQVYTASGNLAYFDGSNDAYIDINGNFNAQNGIVRLGNVNGAAGLTSGSTARLALGVNNSEKVSIQNDGNVGIGTTNPGAKLGFVAATNAVGGIDFGGDTNLYRSAANSLKTDDEFYIGGQFLRILGGGWEFVLKATAGQLQLRNNTDSGYLDFGAANLTSNGNLVVTGTSDLRGAVSNSTGILTLSDDTNIGANALYVQNTNGNVGIGTTVPAQKLDVAGVFAVDAVKKLAGVGLTNMDNIAGTSTNNFVIYSANSDAGITIYTPTSYDGSLYFGRSSDGNQGGFVYDFAAGDLGIKTNNTANQIVVKGTGSVGINTSAPEAKLDVAGPMRVSSAGDVGISHDLYFEDTTSASINSYGPLTITSGNPNSNYNLVLKGAGTGKVIVDDDFSATGNIELGDASADTISIHGTVVGASPALLVNQSAADDIVVVQDSGSTVFKILDGGNAYFLGNVGIGTTIPGSKLETVGSGATSATSSLNIKNSSGTPMLYVRDDGRVGIGTTVPEAGLHVAGNAVITGDIFWRNQPVMRDDSSSGNEFRLNAAGNGNIMFSNSASGAPDLVVSSTGNVGIGTTNPGYILQIAQGGAPVYGPTLHLKSTETTGNTFSALRFTVDNGNAENDTFRLYETDAGDFKMGEGNGSGGFNDRLWIRRGVDGGHIVLQPAGNIGIGTQSPGQKLTVTGTIESTSGGFKFPDGTTQASANTSGGWTDGGTNVYLTTTTDNVGIGTTAPGAKFVVQSGTDPFSFKQAEFIINSDTTIIGNDYATVGLQNLNTAAGNFNTIAFHDSGGYFNASISGIYTNHTTHTGELQFTTRSASGLINAMRIDSTGNVGIGTTSSQQILHIASNSNPYLEIQNTKTSGSGEMGIQWNSDSNRVGKIYMDRIDGDLQFIAGTGTTPNMTILFQGNVGIGTTGPGAKLDVSGDGRFHSDSGVKFYSTGDTDWASIDRYGVYIQSGNIWLKHNGTADLGTIRNFRLVQNTDQGVIYSENTGAVANTLYLKTGIVGIGTTAPEAKLDIAGPLRINSAGDTGIAQDLVLTNIDASTIKSYGPLTIQSGGSNDNYNLTLKGTGTGKVYVDDDLQITGDLTLPALSIPASGTVTFGTDTNLYRSAANTLKTDDTLNITGNLQVTGSGPHYIQSGNVGIGTTSPATNLDVKGNAVIGSGAYLANTQLTLGSGGNSPIVFRAGTVVASLNNGDGEGPILASNYYRNNASADVFPNAAVPAWRMVMNSRADLDFMKIERAPAGSSTWSTFVNIKNDGNVGIGTTQPIAKLDFAAATNAAGGIDFGGDTNLYRSGANTLQTDDDFYIGSYLKLYTSTGNVSTGGLGDFDNNGSGRTQIGAVGPVSQSGLTFSDGATFDTNLYRITANLLGTDDTFYVGGNIGIGTTGPAGKLYVLGDSSVATSVYIDNPSTALNSNLIFRENGVDKAFIRYINSTNALGSAQQNDLQISNSAGDITFTSGNVGIGTTAPSKKLDVSGDILITGTDAATPYTFSSSRDGATNLLIQNTSINTNAAMQLLLGLNDAGSGAEIDAAKFAVGKIDNTAGSLDSYLDIYTMKDGATTQRVRIDNNGNVGIGTIEPGAPLEVKSSSSGASITGLLIRNANTTTNTAAAIKFYNSTSTSFAGSSQIESTRTDVGAAGTSDLRFSNWNGSALNEIMRITGGGNVGIGTTSPGEKLEVSGNIKLTGRIRQGNMGDMAEMIALSKTALTGSLRPEPKDVVIVDQAGGIIKCNQVSSPLVIGIISTNPAHILMEGLPDSLPVALSGVVPCKVSDENGLIKPGDLLVSASISGYAMKAGPDPAPGTVIAKALEVQKEKLDSINVLVMMR